MSLLLLIFAGLLLLLLMLLQQQCVDGLCHPEAHTHTPKLLAVAANDVNVVPCPPAVKHCVRKWQK
jgi:hypothetical protein